MPLPPSPPPQPPLLPPPLPCTVLPCTEASDNDVPGLYSVQHLPSHGRALLTSVSTVDGLDIALANTAVSHVVLSAGTYYLSAELRASPGASSSRLRWQARSCWMRRPVPLASAVC